MALKGQGIEEKQMFYNIHTWTKKIGKDIEMIEMQKFYLVLSF